MDEFGAAFRKTEVANEDERPKALPPSLPATSSYIPFLESPDKKERPRKLTGNNATEVKRNETTASTQFVSRYIFPPDFPPLQTNPAIEANANDCEQYIPVPVVPNTYPIPVYIPTTIAPTASTDKSDTPTLSRKKKRNKKRNLARRGKDSRPRNEGRRETQSINPDDPYWTPALDSAVVAVKAHFVNRRAKMSDGAQVIVRSFNDGTVTAIRDDEQVILMGPTQDSSETTH